MDETRDDRPPTDQPTGHDRLIADLRHLLKLAEDYEFDDFKNSAFAMPKVELNRRLTELATKVREGRYDQTGSD